MSTEDSYGIDGRTGGFRVDGQLTFPQIVHACDSAIRSAIDRGLEGLLLDGTAVSVSYIPTMVERHAMVRRWAATADGKLVIAMAARCELVDSEKFGVVAAANFGLVGNVFTCSREAEVWLRQVLEARPSPSLATLSSAYAFRGDLAISAPARR